MLILTILFLIIAFLCLKSYLEIKDNIPFYKKGYFSLLKVDKDCFNCENDPNAFKVYFSKEIEVQWYPEQKVFRVAYPEPIFLSNNWLSKMSIIGYYWYKKYEKQINKLI